MCKLRKGRKGERADQYLKVGSPAREHAAVVDDAVNRSQLLLVASRLGGDALQQVGARSEQERSAVSSSETMKLTLNAKDCLLNIMVTPQREVSK